MEHEQIPADAATRDPYARGREHVLAPPRTVAGALRRIGPGLILTGAIVGSGELIATTVLGAENGYSLLWLIVLSCLVKVAIQHELGRYAIATGETALEALNRLPGPRWRVAWPVWLWLLMVTAVMFPVGGMLGGVGDVLNRMAPSVSITVWVWGVVAATLALLLIGRYGVVEKTSIALVSLFSLVTIGAAGVLIGQPSGFDWSDIAAGLQLRAPQGGLATAAAVFGMTGVGAGELIMYPSWCIEKGYARFAGSQSASPDWAQRVLGWTRVMRLDVAAAFVVYTFSTVAFYMLGAGTPAGLAEPPRGSDMVETLATLYTATLGAWSAPLFLGGAVAVFYSSIFSATAAHGRLLADFAVINGWCGRQDCRRRLTLTRAFLGIALLLPTLCFFSLKEPVLMVKVGGIAQALMLPVIGVATIYVSARLPQRIQPAFPLRSAAWGSTAVMLVAALYYLIQTGL